VPSRIPPSPNNSGHGLRAPGLPRTCEEWREGGRDRRSPSADRPSISSNVCDLTRSPQARPQQHSQDRARQDSPLFLILASPDASPSVEEYNCFPFLVKGSTTERSRSMEVVGANADDALNRGIPGGAAQISWLPPRSGVSALSHPGRHPHGVRSGSRTASESRPAPSPEARSGNGMGRVASHPGFQPSEGGTDSLCAPLDDVREGSTTFGSSAAPEGPVALRPSLAAGLPLSCHRRERGNIPSKSQKANRGPGMVQMDASISPK